MMLLLSGNAFVLTECLILFWIIFWRPNGMSSTNLAEFIFGMKYFNFFSLTSFKIFSQIRGNSINVFGLECLWIYNVSYNLNIMDRTANLIHYPLATEHILLRRFAYIKLIPVVFAYDFLHFVRTTCGPTTSEVVFLSIYRCQSCRTFDSYRGVSAPLTF